MKITKTEEKWILRLQKLMEECPTSLYLFSNGNLHVMKYDKNGKPILDDNGTFHTDSIASTINYPYSDGGDF